MKLVQRIFFFFADDCSLIVSGNTPENTIEILKRDLDKKSKWASKWKITFSASKTRDIQFSKKVLEGVQPLQFNNQIIPRVSSLIHLGLQLTFNLDWKEQVGKYNVFKSKQEAFCTKKSKKLTKNNP